MKLIFERVKKMLEDNPHLRDSDNKLIANIWFNDSQQKTKMGFLQELADGKLTTPESITRARRKVQEECPELRGKKYRERQDEQDNVKQQLREWNY